MSYFDDASLVMIPSGYKTDKVYSVKPTDGTGDLTFTRSNDTATRVNSAGLIEKVRTNLALRSQDFANATWAKSGGVTLTAGQTDPNGGTTASRIVFATGSDEINQTVSTSAGLNTISVYIKGTAGETVSLNDSTSSTLVTLTASFVRYTLTSTHSGSGSWLKVTPAAGTARDIVIAFAQSESGDIATQYIPTTTAAVSVGPVANVPRLDYLGSSCPRLLLEPQRTNKITYSENQGPSGTNWYPSTTWTVTKNTVTSPSGYQDADTLTETTSTGFHSGYFNATIESSYTGTYTISAFAKYNGRIFVLNPYPTGVGRTYFDLQNGTVLQAGTGVTAKIENYGNGWYRCICTASFSSQNVSFEHMLASAVGTLQYTGDGTSGVHIWGCMAEAGSYATSYIPTLGAAVTRGADAASKTGISSLIGQTEGTLFMEFNSFAASYPLSVLCSVTKSDASKRAYAEINGTTITMGFVGSAANSATSTIVSGTNKVAIAYKNGDIAFYHNGVLKGTGAANVDWAGTVDIFNASGLYFFSPTYAFNEKEELKQALVFKTRLTNAQLAELTTL